MLGVAAELAMSGGPAAPCDEASSAVLHAARLPRPAERVRDERRISARAFFFVAGDFAPSRVTLPTLLAFLSRAIFPPFFAFLTPRLTRPRVGLTDVH